jgi:hypothetical protein
MYTAMFNVKIWLIGNFGFLAPKDFLIIWLSNILAMSVPDH